jgi:hypothetical protein
MAEKRKRRYRWSDKMRCRATEVAVDMPVPYEERCVRKRGHTGKHRCCHGFHWSNKGTSS